MTPPSLDTGTSRMTVTGAADLLSNRDLFYARPSYSTGTECVRAEIGIPLKCDILHKSRLMNSSRDRMVHDACQMLNVKILTDLSDDLVTGMRRTIRISR